MTKEKKRYLMFVLIGIAGFILGAYLWYELDQMEKGTGGSVSLPRLLYSLYELAGKWAVAAGCVFSGIFCIVFGKMGYEKAKKAEAIEKE
ncbi:hypothetical protein AwDysgo_16080 [Bacteroidales bacterium]|nr:hypothetical protein AwDysgo_16080 [Bacteroidales bacterium]